MASVAFSRRDEEWLVRGVERRGGPSGELLLTREDLPLIKAAELKKALAAKRDFYGTDEARASVSELPEEYFDADGPVGPIDLELTGDRLTLSVLCFVAWPEDGNEDVAAEHLFHLLEPYCRDHGLYAVDVKSREGWSGPMDLAMTVTAAGTWRGKTVQDLIRHGEEILRLVDAFASGSPTRETVAHLVRGGGAHLLVGQPEGNWLDVKAEEYDLSALRGKISLAQAVARFANAEDGGLIVIGAKAKKVPGGETIRQVSGVTPRQEGTAARYLRVLDQHLYPPVLGLQVALVPTTEGRCLIAIEVPRQPEEQKPFLVHGAITADGDTEGAFISIVQRRGEGSIPVTAPMIHASLAAGRALLRGHVLNPQRASGPPSATTT